MAPGLLGDPLSDRRRTGEGDETRSGVLHQCVADAIAGAHHHVEGARWHPRGGEVLGQAKGRERSGAGGFCDHGIPRGKGRSDLVTEQVERKIERADRHDHSDRVADAEQEPMLVPRGVLVGVRGKALPAEMADLLGREQKDPGGTDRLDARVRDRLAHLVRNQER